MERVAHFKLWLKEAELITKGDLTERGGAKLSFYCKLIMLGTNSSFSDQRKRLEAHCSRNPLKRICLSGTSRLTFGQVNILCTG